MSLVRLAMMQIMMQDWSVVGSRKAAGCGLDCRSDRASPFDRIIVWMGGDDMATKKALSRKVASRSGGSGRSKQGGVTANPLARVVATAKTMKRKGRVTAALSDPHRETSDATALARKVSAAKRGRKKEQVTEALEESQRRR